MLSLDEIWLAQRGWTVTAIDISEVAILRARERSHPAGPSVMVDPTQLADGDHHTFVSGDDDQAKTEVIELLQSFGWKLVIDLGGIATARTTEMYLPLWATLMGALGTPMFNVRIVQG